MSLEFTALIGGSNRWQHSWAVAFKNYSKKKKMKMLIIKKTEYNKNRYVYSSSLKKHKIDKLVHKVLEKSLSLSMFHKTK